MSTSKSRERRDERIRQHVKDGLTDKEIADREGMDPTNMTSVYKRLGIKPVAKDKKRALTVTGLTSKTDVYTRLASMLAQVQREHGEDTIEVAHLVGLTQRQQGAAIVPIEKGWYHNWTLGQLQRLADALGITLSELFLRAGQPIRKGEAV